MGVKGYLNEKSVLEIWAFRPGPNTPPIVYTEISRTLAEKYKICPKSVQKIWNRVCWAKVTERALIAQSECQLAADHAKIDTGMPANVTADASLESGARTDPERSLLSPRSSFYHTLRSSFFSQPAPFPSSDVSTEPQDSGLPALGVDAEMAADCSPLCLLPPPSSLLHPPSSPFLPHHLPPLASNATTLDSSLPSLEVAAGMNQDISLLSPTSADASALSYPLSHHASALLSPSIVSQNNSLQADTQAIVARQDNAEPWLSLAESSLTTNSRRALRAGGRQRRAHATCAHCKARKLKCDMQQPCGGCMRRGLAAECSLPPPLASASPRPRLPSPSRHHAAVGLARGGALTDPEHPIAFPSGPVWGRARVVGEVGGEGGVLAGWPLSLLRVLKAFRLADHIVARMLRLLTPKLRAVILRVFGAMDGVFVAKEVTASDGGEGAETGRWAESMRCGMMKVRLDLGAATMSAIDANPFWTELAGLHKEEFAARALTGELDLNTSELRQFCKLVFGMKEFVKVKIERLSNPEAQIERPLYCRMSRHWGRGRETEGVLTRMRGTSSNDDNDPTWMYLHTSIVVISAEEYEAVRARQPELCEGYLIPVVGSKSAAELMDPRLLQQESFHAMHRTAKGRAQLDRLADVISDEFSFMFDFFAQQYRSQRPLPSA